ncbi:hypothetical protein, partial [Desulfococcus sp.]|uniref:hypothetical protein n=1 Tax=Desulfococcus sp. TaxID=2025834 RepID=UPI003593AE31
MIDDLKLSTTTVNAYSSMIKQMVKWAVAKELLPGEAHWRLSAVRGVTARDGARAPRRVTLVEDAIVDATLPFLSNDARTMVQVQRLTGMRPGELVIMRSIDIETSGATWMYRPFTHKTEHHGAERVIAIGPRAQV